MLRMTRVLIVTLLLGLLVGPALALPGDVLHTIPTPGPAPTGLAYDGTHLWVADQLSDTLYALDPETGAIVTSWPAPGFVPMGMTWDGAHLWVIDQEEGRINALDVESGITVKSFEAPTPSPEGIAWDGAHLWLSDARADIICQISREDGTTIEEFTAPMNGATGLTCWKGYLWSADRMEDKIYLVDPKHDGEVVLALDAPGMYARGLATDGEVLWNVDYQSDKVFKLVIDDGETTRKYDPHTLDMLLTYEFRNYGPGEVTSLDAWIAVPHDGPGQTIVNGPTFSPAPLDFPEDRWEQKVAHYHLADPPLAARERMTMRVRVNLNAFREYVYPEKVGELEDIPKDIRKAYLVNEDKYRIHDPRIVKAVQEAVGDETNPYWIMRRIHKYIRDRLHYELSGGWNVAPRVLERGNGSCSEYTFLFISMCRAAGVPARYVGSVVVRGDEASTDPVFHRWSQVYLPGYGWVHVDPQGGDKDKPGQVAESIGQLSNRFLLTTFGGGASEYLGWGYNYDQAWQAKGPVKVHAEAVGEWSPVPDEANGAAAGPGGDGQPFECVP